VSAQLFPSVESHIIDANLFIRFERHDTVRLLERAVTEDDIVLLLPTRVYEEELTPESYPHGTPRLRMRSKPAGYSFLRRSTIPIRSFRRQWISFASISAATDRPPHTIEQADAEVGGAAATLLEQGQTESIAIYTNDLPAFRGIERALSQHGYEEPVQLVKAFDFSKSVENRYQFSG